MMLIDDFTTLWEWNRLYCKVVILPIMYTFFKYLEVLLLVSYYYSKEFQTENLVKTVEVKFTLGVIQPNQNLCQWD